MMKTDSSQIETQYAIEALITPPRPLIPRLILSFSLCNYYSYEHSFTHGYYILLIALYALNNPSIGYTNSQSDEYRTSLNKS